MEKKEVSPVTQEYLQRLTANPLRESLEISKELLAEVQRLKSHLTAQGAALAALIHSHPEPGKALDAFLSQVDHLSEDQGLLDSPQRRAGTAEALATLRPVFEEAYRQATAGD